MLHKIHKIIEMRMIEKTVKCRSFIDIKNVSV